MITAAKDFTYVVARYGVPAKRGRVVTMGKEKGVIYEARGHYVGVNFDKDKPGTVHNVHPNDLVYTDTFKTPRRMTRSQARYARYLRSILSEDVTFGDWIKYGYYKETEAGK